MTVEPGGDSPGGEWGIDFYDAFDECVGDKSSVSCSAFPMLYDMWGCSSGAVGRFLGRSVRCHIPGRLAGEWWDTEQGVLFAGWS